MIINQINFKKMRNLMTTTNARFFKSCLIFMLPAVFLCGCDDTPIHRVWYGDNGMLIEGKTLNDKGAGRWKYVVRDNFGDILIRTNEDWIVGDTLWVG